MRTYVPALGRWVETEPVQTGVVKIVDEGPLYIVRLFDTNKMEWYTLSDGVTGEPIEFGRLEIAIGVADSRAAETGFPATVEVKS